MVGSLLVLWIRARRVVVALAVLMAVSTLLNAMWFVLGERSDLLVGYYLWWASFALVA